MDLIHLDVKTSYSFLTAYGTPDQIIDRAKEIGLKTIGIADFSSTWGHIKFWKAAKAADIKPIFGVELAISETLEKDPRYDLVVLLAKNLAGLEEQYELLSQATAQFYYRPRITWDQLNDLKDNFIIATSVKPSAEMYFGDLENFYIGVSPQGGPILQMAKKRRWRTCISVSPMYPKPEYREAHRLVRSISSARRVSAVENYPFWIMTEKELEIQFRGIVDVPAAQFYEWCESNQFIAEQCSVSIPTGGHVEPKVEISIEKWCQLGSYKKGIDLSKEPYASRYAREIELIHEKGFADYFLLIADMIAFAKQRMLVGPARGSSAGSLVCYLMDITEIDPIPHGLLFERFIDINRSDLPDIDIDFPDDKRDLVFDYVFDTYGDEHVVRLGTVSMFKPKSALNDTAKSYSIPGYKIKKLNEVMIERSGGDARANMCIEDTINQFEIGQLIAKDHPKILMAGQIEGHPRHTGKHAAGIIISTDKISKYCAVNRRDSANIGMLDKYDAEIIDLMKIDALGLKTLTVLEDCCRMAGTNPKKLYTLPLDIPEVFKIFQEDRVAGIFQFEGYAVRSLMRQMGVDRFDDIVALTALARPGPLHGGGASIFVERKRGDVDWGYEIPQIKDITSETYGTIVFQEQVMKICREVGRFSWADTSMIRKTMSKTMGVEFFNQFEKKFIEGAKKDGIDPAAASHLWKTMCTFGSWGFNKSHAVSYALLSYWCAYLKVKHPLEFAVSHLRRTSSEDHVLRLLRELIKEGYNIVPFDPFHFELNWSHKDNTVYGGLLEVKGIGPVTANKIMELKEVYGDDYFQHLKPGVRSKILAPNNTPWVKIDRIQKKWGDYYDNPDLRVIPFGMSDPKPVGVIRKIDEIVERKGTYKFIGTLKQRNLRDLNEAQSVARRGYEVKDFKLFLNLIFEDDTGSILCTVDRYRYPYFAPLLMEKESDGKDFIVKGNIYQDGRRKIYITSMVDLDGTERDRNRQEDVGGSTQSASTN